MQRLYLLAGEDSGDLHASSLVKALRVKRPDILLRGLGGDRMAASGVELVAHLSAGNFMGFGEVVKNLGAILRLFRQIKEDVRQWKPDAVVMVDYPAFNLRLAPFFHALGIPIYFYISPQLWAWKKGRVKIIRKYVERMLVILPFEQEFYAREQVEVDFVGHPLLDVISSQPKILSSPPIIALLPGSRKQEIQRMLPVMLTLTKAFPDHRFVVAGAPSQPASLYHSIVGDSLVELWMNRTYELLSKASCAAVTSGTATLETALFRVPEVVCYRGSAISYAIGKRLVKVPFISLVNLILGRRAVQELIQRDMNPERLTHEMRQLMLPDVQERMAQDYQDLWHKLGSAGASHIAAKAILKAHDQYLEKKSVISQP